jgi:UDP-glucose 4-epimerase
VVAISRRAAGVFADAPLVTPFAADLAVGPPDMKEVHGPVRLICLASRITGSKDPAELSSLLRTDTCSHLLLAETLADRLVHVTYASSITVYGYITPGTASKESDALRPLNQYAVTKVASEISLAQLAQEHGFPLALLRISQVYGPGAPQHGALYEFLASAKAGTVVKVQAGDTFRDFVHVDDVVTAIIRASTRPATGTYNIGGGAPVTMRQLGAAALHVAGRTDPPLVASNADLGSMVMDTSAARDGSLLAEPPVTLIDGLRHEITHLPTTAP